MFVEGAVHVVTVGERRFSARSSRFLAFASGVVVASEFGDGGFGPAAGIDLEDLEDGLCRPRGGGLGASFPRS
jgi:uncharacterized protein (AIM24 family)